MLILAHKRLLFQTKAIPAGHVNHCSFSGYIIFKKTYYKATGFYAVPTIGECEGINLPLLLACLLQIWI